MEGFVEDGRTVGGVILNTYRAWYGNDGHERESLTAMNSSLFDVTL